MKRFITIVVILLILSAATFFLVKHTGDNTGGLPSSPRTGGTEKELLLVNADHPLKEEDRPQNLVNLFEKKDRHFQLATADIEVCDPVYKAMDAMFAAAEKDGVDGFIVSSGYRSFEKQAAIFADSEDGLAAKPGTSEHETGLAFDVTAYGDEDFELTPQFEWLSTHCAAYGFIIRYPKGKEDITGISFEPWHYRYVGTPYAKEIMDKGLTLEEYQ